MGFMGFFSRKPTPAPQQPQHDPLRAQPYNATVASLPPKIGTVPVAGNGPNILETLQKTHPKFKNTRDISFGEHSPLPASVIQDDSFDRPQTAPSQDRYHTWSARRRSGSLTDYPVPAVPTLPPPPPPKPRPPYRLPDKYATNPPAQTSTKKGPPYRLPDNILDRAILNKPLPSFARGRSLSIASSRSSTIGGHVDLLDAQAGFNPTDFRLRLRANGARDYGEDVADRNLGDNCSSLHSGERRASYASRNGSRPTSLVPVAHDDVEDQIGSKQNKRHSLGSSLRSTSLTSSALATKPKVTSHLADVDQPPPIPPKSRIRVTEDGLIAPPKAEWRRSLPSYASASRQLRGQDYAGEFLENSGAETSASARVDDDKDEQRTRSQVRRVTEDKAVEEFGAAADVAAVPRPPRDSASKGDENEKRRSMSHILNWRTTSGPSKRLSLQNLQTLSSRLDSFKDEAFRIKPRGTTPEPAFSERRRPSTACSQDAPAVAEIQMKAFSSPPKVKSSPRRLTARERFAAVEKASSKRPGSSKGLALTRIDSNEVPDRSSSMRHWSMDSTSATSLSSNPFRPQSRHTANTSIDLSPLAKEASLSHDSLGSISYRTGENSLYSSLATASAATPPPPEPMLRSSDLFNIDDYLSSDDDPDAPRHPRGEGEEHLLFKDSGFAFSGTGLPGLNGALDAGAPRYTPSSPPRPNSRQSRSGRPQRSYDHDDDFLGSYKPPRGESNQAARLRLARARVAAYQLGDSDSSDREEFQFVEDDDSEDELSFDIPMRRSNPAPSYRPARYASREQVIEEETDFSQLDLASALRIRKEEKRRKRLSGASGSTVRPRSNSGKGKEAARPRRYDAAGFDQR